MKVADIRGKDSRELRLDLQALDKELFELRFRSSTEEVSETARFRQIRRQVAQIKTVLRERELAQISEQQASSQTAAIAGQNDN
jgi:large subunit ribosomal protein L29